MKNLNFFIFIMIIFISCKKEQPSLPVPLTESEILTEELKGEYIGACYRAHTAFETPGQVYGDTGILFQNGGNASIEIDSISMDLLWTYEGSDNLMENDTLKYSGADGEYSGKSVYILRSEKEIWTASSYSHNVPEGTIETVCYFKSKN